MRSSRARCIVIAASALAAVQPARAGDLRDTVDRVAAANTAAVKSQARVEDVSDQTFKLLNEYRDLQRRIDSMQVYVAQIEKLTTAQEAELADLRTQIDSATQIGREITPLMLRMLQSLERFVELDLPFLVQERRARLQGLREMLDRADVADSEKYRRILEAYQIETEFGRTIEAYDSELDGDGKKRTVSFLRFGRIALFYQTFDGEETGHFDRDSRRFEPLPDTYAEAVRKGLRMARKQTTPDLLRLPIPGAQDAR